MRTIVQEYGPIYGEPVNGTVMGRPNGSVYVPISNTIELELPEESRYFIPTNTNTLVACDSSGNRLPPFSPIGPHYVAIAQDLSSNVQLQIYSDSDLENLVAYRDMAAGDFNYYVVTFFNYDGSLSDGDTIYFRVQLMNNGVPVATSNAIECKAVVPA